MIFLRLVLSVGAFTTIAAAAEQADVVRAMQLARDAATAAQDKDYPSYLAKMEAAIALRSDIPRMLVNLAAAQVANDRADEAIATLERLAALGLSSPVEKSPDFTPLRGRKDFDAVVKKLAANMHPKGNGQTAFALREVSGLIEGIAWREKTGEFYFGDVNGRAVWTKNKDGILRRFTPEGDDLFGVFGLAVDEARAALWVATSAVPAMRGFTPDQDGTAALAEIDLETGVVRRTIPVVRQTGDQQSHVLGDLSLADDGSVFVTDSGAPVLWRLGPGESALVPWVESPEFISLQGMVILPGGGAIVSDHANGLLHVNLQNRSVRRLEPPPSRTLVGLDGLALSMDGSVLAIQNGLRPNRVLRIMLDPRENTVTAVTVLESGHITMAAPSLGCIATDGDFFFIGNAGWTRFEEAEGRPTGTRSVPIFKTQLGAEKLKH